MVGAGAGIEGWFGSMNCDGYDGNGCSVHAYSQCGQLQWKRLLPPHMHASLLYYACCMLQHTCFALAMSPSPPCSTWTSLLILLTLSAHTVPQATQHPQHPPASSARALPCLSNTWLTQAPLIASRHGSITRSSHHSLDSVLRTPLPSRSLGLLSFTPA